MSGLSFPSGHIVDSVFETARASGVAVFLVGGAVRDRLLGLGRPSDYDFVYDGDYERLKRELFARIRFREVLFSNKGFQTSRLCFRDVTVDFQEAGGGDLRRDSVKRDFSVNALYLEKQGERYALVDHVDGLADIKKRVIRQVTRDSMADDPLRVLRAFRFASQLDFSVEPATLARAGELGALIHKASQERVVYELKKLFESPSPHAIEAMVSSGAADTLFGFRALPPQKGFGSGAVGNMFDLFDASGKSGGFADFLRRYGFSNRDRDLAYAIMSAEFCGRRETAERLYKKSAAILDPAVEYFRERGKTGRAGLLESIRKNERCILNGEDVAARFGVSGRELGKLIREAHLRQILYGVTDRKELSDHIGEYIGREGRPGT